ncbi:protein spire isoform X2 [Nasonia vitripennis]|uniref:KIND domain-containing protein n=1 Tax=Nasonia vitripennis TaxID=7425 RepID=A0A7M7T981_NASVI|nr:protein spire isoform X2 [Nasonia vitripennis]
MMSENGSQRNIAIDNNFVNLQNILELLNFPINEEQAWSICYQALKFFLDESNVFCRILKFSQILLHKNGNVTLELLKDAENVRDVTEKDAIFSLGLILFNALDYGLSEEVEISLRPELQHLIACMTNLSIDISVDLGDKDNEKIVNDQEVSHRGRQMTNQILHADGRIWRAIQVRFWGQVIDELEKKITVFSDDDDTDDDDDDDNDRKCNHDDHLRYVPYLLKKKKKCKSSAHEILMDDIRKRRYCLKNISRSSISLKKDSFSAILELVKSKPQLKKASDRVLPPLKKEYNLHELLMESIKRPPKPLRSTRNPKMSDQNIFWLDVDIESTNNYFKKEEMLPTSQNLRKLIPVDFDLKLDEDEEDDADNNITIDSNVRKNIVIHKSSKCISKLLRSVDKIENTNSRDDSWKLHDGLQLTKHEYHKFCDVQLESYDLATQCPSRQVSARKHRDEFQIISKYSKDDPDNEYQQDSRKNCLNFQSSNVQFTLIKKPVPKPRNTIEKGKTSLSDETSNEKVVNQCLNEMLLEDRLSLTLEEIVHIRNVLTKAELESLPVEGSVKEDVEKRRICFLCLKTRFGILGPWGQRCRLCDRTICVKCYSKMKIPTDHFSQVPVLLLSPALLLSPSSMQSDSDVIKNSWSKCNRAFDSAPTSPAAKRQNPEIPNDILLKPSNKTKFTKQSETSNKTFKNILYETTAARFDYEKRTFLEASESPIKFSIARTLRAQYRNNPDQELKIDRLRGISMVVCHDCRLMVAQIIKSSRSTRANIRNNVISRLTLNLSPAYI